MFKANNLKPYTQDTQKIQLLWIILGLRIVFFLLEVEVGIWSHSLSLLAGAGHLFSDLLTLGLTLVAALLVQRQPQNQTAWKYKRLEAWVALFNGASLGAFALLIAWEAVKHLQNPEPISLRSCTKLKLFYYKCFSSFTFRLIFTPSKVSQLSSDRVTENEIA